MSAPARLLLLGVASAVVPPPDSLFDSKHGIKMGVPSDGCDDGKMGLTMDWAGSPVEYTCFMPFKRRLEVRDDLKPIQNCTHLPSTYFPKHFCMDHKLTYNETIPTYGPHRPLWAVFGEYIYLPPQRWLHNVEHGSVVMLYHPCADHQEVARLRDLVRGCIRKHVITPYPALSAHRPLALVAWGCRLEMAHVDAAAVQQFIRQKALHGPEGDYPKQGQYEFQLLHRAEPPPGSDLNDTLLCPAPT